MLSRRTALLVGLGAIAAACTGRSPSAALGSPSPSAASDTTPTASPVATPACVATPAETEGPYFRGRAAQSVRYHDRFVHRIEAKRRAPRPHFPGGAGELERMHLP